MSTPFAMVGDQGAGLCVDGVCAVPPPAATAPADAPSPDVDQQPEAERA